MIHVAIFDDHKERQIGLRMLIESSAGLRCVGAFSDCREVVSHVDQCKPDVILMDINMPHEDGIAGVKRLRKEERFNDIKIIMQTVLEEEDRILESILSGADGYLLKQTSPLKLIDSITEVYHGGAPMSPRIARKVLNFLNGQPKKPSGDPEFKLTKRESQVLSLLVDGMSYKMIASECNISYPTVNSHISNIYSKLQVRSVAGAVKLAMSKGLV